jgi:integrase
MEIKEEKMAAKKGRRSNGEGTWSEKNINGISYQVLTKSYEGKRKSYYGKTKKEAKTKADLFERENKLISTSEIQSMSLYMYSHEWLFHWRNAYGGRQIKPKTFDYYDMIIENYLKDTPFGLYQMKNLNKLPDIYLKNMAKEHLESYKQKLSKSTIDGIYTVLKQVIKYAFDNHDIKVNFMESVSKISEDIVAKKKKERKVLSPEEVSLLWKEMLRVNTAQVHINGPVGSYVYGIGAYALLFCCFTGLRWGEVSCLRWEDIDFKNGVFSVTKQYVRLINRNEDISAKTVTVQGTPKSKKSNRFVPLCDQALELLNLVRERFSNYYKPENLIFSTSGKPYSDSNANRLLKCMCIRSDITVVTAHELRHTFATILLNEDGQNVKAISDILGHSQESITFGVYLHSTERSRAMAMDVFSNVIFNDSEIDKR